MAFSRYPPFPPHHLQRRWTGFYPHWPYLTDTIHKKRASSPDPNNQLPPRSLPFIPFRFIPPGYSYLLSHRGKGERLALYPSGALKMMVSWLFFFWKNIHTKDIIVQQILHSSSQRHRDYADRYEIRLGLYFLDSCVDSFPWLHSRSFLAVPQ